MNLKSAIKLVLIALGLTGMASCASMQGGLGGLGTGTSVPSTSTDNSDSNGSQSLLGSLLSGLIGNAVKLNDQMLIGTWTYQSPECRFESENALSQAGGAVAASTVESKLADMYAKIGIKPGACSFTFNQDKTCTITMGSRTINGTYTLDADKRALNIKSNTGIIKLNATVYYSFDTLTLLFDAQKLLSVAQALSAFTGQGSSTIGALSGVLNQYKGMKLGMNLKK